MTAVLWCGGEDIDFPNGSAVTNVNSGFRSNYARTSLENQTTTASYVSSRSMPFAGGSVTGCWLHFYATTRTLTTSVLFAGLGLSTASNANSGLFVGTGASTATKLTLYKYDGTTLTALATESGTTLANATSFSFDIQVISFGASATVNVYLNSNLLIAYSGSTAITGMAAIDSVMIGSDSGTAGALVSEFIVTDTVDTRATSLVTMAPNGPGANNQWDSGTYANINPVTINDSSVISVNSTGKIFEATLNGLPAGTFTVSAVRIVARAQVQAGAVPTGLQIGTYEAGTAYPDSGRSLTNAFVPYDRLMLTDPATSAAWVTSALGTLQIDLQSQ